jgi:hypothetical protein
MVTINAEAAAINTDALRYASVHSHRNVHHTRVATLVLVHSKRSYIVPMSVELAIHQGNILIVAHQHVPSDEAR